MSLLKSARPEPWLAFGCRPDLSLRREENLIRSHVNWASTYQEFVDLTLLHCVT